MRRSPVCLQGQLKHSNSVLISLFQPSPPPGPSTSLAGDTDSDAGQSESTQEPTQDPSTGEQPHKKGWGKRTKNRAKALWNKAKARIHRN